MRTITIEIAEAHDDEPFGFTVRASDGRFADRLCWDEALGTVVELLHPRLADSAVRYLKTPEQHAADELRHEQRMREIAALHEASAAVTAANEAADRAWRSGLNAYLLAIERQLGITPTFPPPPHC